MMVKTSLTGILFLCLLFICTQNLNAQIKVDENNSILIGNGNGNMTTTAVPSAKLQIAPNVEDGFYRGFLKPRMDTDAMNMIISPAVGLEIFNTTENTTYYYDGAIWRPYVGQGGTIFWGDIINIPLDFQDGIDNVVDVNAWHLDGNSATATDKLGTTSVAPLRIVTSNIERMRITENGDVGIGTDAPEGQLHLVGRMVQQFPTSLYNNVIGSNAGNFNMTGDHNNFFGSNAGSSNTTGKNNNFLGGSAGLNNTSGGNNNFLGFRAGLNNETGDYNNFIGLNAGRENISGLSNNFIGPSAGRFNNEGSGNNFLGQNAGYNNTLGNSNNFLGSIAGYKNINGNHNNFLGNSAGYNNTNGSSNNFLGVNAGYKNINGSHNNYFGVNSGFHNNGYHNFFAGQEAGYYVTSGSDNTLIGAKAGKALIGNNNVGIGNSTLHDIEGDDNIAIGNRAGSNSYGSGSIYIGRDAGDNAEGGFGIFIGYQAGQNEYSGNRLYIDNSNTSDPLIYGEFNDDEILKINGRFHPAEDLMDADGDSGTPGQVLTSTGTGTDWADASSGVSGVEWRHGGDDLAAEQTIGTKSNHDFPIITNNVEHIRVTKDGKVGVNTISPTTDLDIDGGVRIRGPLYDKFNASGINGQVLISTANGVDWRPFPNDHWNVSGNSGNENHVLGLTSNHDLDIITNNKLRLTIDKVGRLIPNFDETSSIVIGQFSGQAGMPANLIIGSYSGMNITGLQNVILGTGTGDNISGENNVVLGLGSGNLVSGSNNVILGAGNVNSTTKPTSGNNNIVLGINSGTSLDASQNSIIIGASAGNNVNGFSNIAIGSSAMATPYISDNNIAIGNGAFGAPQTPLVISNSMGFGKGVTPDASNTVKMGDITITHLLSPVAWGQYSDGRFKENIKSNVPGLDMILGLNPVTYNFNASLFNDHIKMPNELRNSEAENVKSSLTETGFIAQEVENLVNDLNYDFSGLERPSSENGVYSLRYSEFVVPLVKATQEQQVLIEDQKTIIESQDKELKLLRSTLEEVLSRVEKLEQN